MIFLRPGRDLAHEGRADRRVAEDLVDGAPARSAGAEALRVFDERSIVLFEELLDELRLAGEPREDALVRRLVGRDRERRGDANDEGVVAEADVVDAVAMRSSDLKT